MSTTITASQPALSGPPHYSRPAAQPQPPHLSDAFLSARLQSTRRLTPSHTAPDLARLRAPSSSSQSLHSVPEDGHRATESRKPSPPPPSAYRHPSVQAMHKGKDRDEGGAERERESGRRKRAEWAVDVVEAQGGRDRWLQTERVVLVTGSVSGDQLSPFLYDPTFANTLLLIGSTTGDINPSIAALASPSQLLSMSPERAIYPTVQPFSCAPGANASVSSAHALPALLTQATKFASQYRSSSMGSSSRMRTPRRQSDDSISADSETPPLTPPSRPRKLSSFGLSGSRRNSLDSSSDHTDASRPHSLVDRQPDTLKPLPEKPVRARLASFGRESILGNLPLSKRSSDTASRDGTSSSGHASSRAPFDAVINFVPPAHDFAPERMMQDMLHQAVVLTSGVLPLLSRRNGKSSAIPRPADLTIPLIHILPSQVPGALPGVLESFLLSLLPTFAGRGDREVWASVITSPAWREQRLNQAQGWSGAALLLFGGIRCPANILSEAEGGGEVKARAFLPNWGGVVPMPGLLAEAVKPRGGGMNTRSVSSPMRIGEQGYPDGSGRSSPVIAQRPVSRKVSDPPSLSYDQVEARTPPSTAEMYSQLPASRPSRHYRSGSSRLANVTSMYVNEPEVEPRTPELAGASQSSCESWPEGPMTDRGGEEPESREAAVEGKGMRRLRGLLGIKAKK